MLPSSLLSKKKNHAYKGSIIKALGDANSRITIAMAFFTDESYLDVLVQKATSVSVKLVLDDNDQNKKLDFRKLEEAGGQIAWVKKEGYNSMHRKECIIDGFKIITGSFNWTKNALSNDETCDIYEDREKALIKEQEIEELFDSATKSPMLSTPEFISEQKPKPATDEGIKKNLERFKDRLVAIQQTLIVSYDLQVLEDEGRQGAIEVNASGSYLKTLLDKLLHDHRVRLEAAEEKKLGVIQPLNNEKLITIQIIQNQKDLKRQSLDSEKASERKRIEEDIRAKEEIKLRVENQITSTQQSIKEASNKIKNHEEDIRDLKEDNFQRKLNHWGFWPVVALAILLGAGAFVFYSSAFYILLDSATDLRFRLESGLQDTFEVMEVFDPYALNKAFQRGGMMIIFIAIAVIIPLFTAFIDQLIKNSWGRFLGWLFIPLVDFLVAYKVSHSVHQIKVAYGQADATLNFWDVTLNNPDFWLVIMLGALPLVFLKLCVKYLTAEFNKTRGDLIRKTNRNKIRALNEAILSLNSIILGHESNLQQLDKNSAQILEDINKHRKALIESEATFENKIAKEAEYFQNLEKSVGEIHSNAVAQVKSGNILINLKSLEAEINRILMGWKRGIPSAVPAAQVEQKMTIADQTFEEWKKERFRGKVAEEL